MKDFLWLPSKWLWVILVNNPKTMLNTMETFPEYDSGAGPSNNPSDFRLIYLLNILAKFLSTLIPLFWKMLAVAVATLFQPLKPLLPLWEGGFICLTHDSKEFVTILLLLHLIGAHSALCRFWLHITDLPRNIWPIPHFNGVATSY